LKQFPKQYEDQMRKEGRKVRYQGYDGQTCAFITLENEGENHTAEPQKPSLEPYHEPRAVVEEPEKTISTKEIPSTLKRSGRWTIKETQDLRRMYEEERLPLAEISERLKRTKSAIESHARNLGLRRKREPSADSPVQPVLHTGNGDGHVKELLRACSLLYLNNHRYAAVVLLHATAKEMEGAIA